MTRAGLTWKELAERANRVVQMVAFNEALGRAIDALQCSESSTCEPLEPVRFHGNLFNSLVDHGIAANARVRTVECPGSSENDPVYRDR